MTNDPRKPLGRKTYGSIGHLRGSRLGPGDHRVNFGQERIATVKARDRHDVVIVQEKLDGSNTSVALLNGQVLALNRAGYLAQTSPYPQHRLFARWVRDREDLFHAILEDGERLVGEWIALTHSIHYDLPHEPFVPFDLMREAKRATQAEVLDRIDGRLPTPQVLATGPTLVGAIMDAKPGHGSAVTEGAVWRVERKGKVDFLTKWVRPTLIPGALLSSITGKPDVWNNWPGRGAYLQPKPVQKEYLP